MFGEQFDRKLAKAEKGVLPGDCKGRVSTYTESRKVGEKSRKNVIVTQLGCAGLLDGLIDVRTSDLPYTDTLAAQRAQVLNAIQNSGSQIMDACATCYLGLAGQDRQQARELRDNADDLRTRLEIAQAEQATAEARLATEKLKQLPNPGE